MRDALCKFGDMVVPARLKTHSALLCATPPQLAGKVTGEDVWIELGTGARAITAANVASSFGLVTWCRVIDRSRPAQ